MGRPHALDDNIVISLRIEKEMYSLLKDISALETLNSGRVVTVLELIRSAVKFTYSDNERLRECFKRSRESIKKRLK